jgi:uncharacterized protein (TIGR00290 family)
MTPVVLLWSGGKDAAMTLRAVRQSDELDARALLTTVTEDDETVTMHGTPLALIRAQAEALNLPLAVMRLPQGAPNDVYERRMKDALSPLREKRLRVVAAGDLFLSDIRDYREALFERIGWEVKFPIWQQGTREMAETFIEEGYRAVVTSVDTTQLNASFAGRAYDRAFLSELPESVDPCGEHGAFHTFVTDGPPFDAPVTVEVGKTMREERMAQARLA